MGAVCAERLSCSRLCVMCQACACYRLKVFKAIQKDLAQKHMLCELFKYGVHPYDLHKRIPATKQQEGHCTHWPCAGTNTRKRTSNV